MRVNASLKLVFDYNKMSEELLETYGLSISNGTLRKFVVYGVPIDKDVNGCVGALVKTHVYQTYVVLKGLVVENGNLERAEAMYADKVSSKSNSQE